MLMPKGYLYSQITKEAYLSLHVIHKQRSQTLVLVQPCEVWVLSDVVHHLEATLHGFLPRHLVLLDRVHENWVLLYCSDELAVVFVLLPVYQVGQLRLIEVYLCPLLCEVRVHFFLPDAAVAGGLDLVEGLMGKVGERFVLHL